MTTAAVTNEKNGYHTRSLPDEGSEKELLLQRIASRQATVGVIGLGYVGLPLAVAFAEAGFKVVGIDLNASRVAKLNAGESYIEDVPSERIARLSGRNGHAPVALSQRRGGAARRSGRLSASADYEAVRELDAVIVCVPTPLRPDHGPDISYIVAAADQLASRLRPGTLVVLESTTYPGTTEELVLPHLAHGTAEGKRLVGRDFFLAFSPERIDPGRLDWDVRTTPKVIGGITPNCLEVAAALYGCAIDTVVPVSTTRVAETVKLLENTFRALNIGLANEMAIMCDHLGVDVWEVIEAARTKPFGFMPFYPGPGLGGHCIPIDPQYLSWKLRTLNYHARFIQLAEEINTAMPDHVVRKLADALNDEGKAVRGARIVILGMAYKANVADARESPSLDIAERLIGRGARLSYHDPHVPHVAVAGQRLESATLDEELLAGSDAVIVVTAHDAYDWPWVLQHSRLVLDTRNATRGAGSHAARVVKL